MRDAGIYARELPPETQMVCVRFNMEGWQNRELFAISRSSLQEVHKSAHCLLRETKEKHQQEAYASLALRQQLENTKRITSRQQLQQ